MNIVETLKGNIVLKNRVITTLILQVTRKRKLAMNKLRPKPPILHYTLSKMVDR